MSERFNFIRTKLNDVIIIEKRYAEDARGSFGRLFCANEFKEIGLKKKIVQINHSTTKEKGTVRGLHFQYPPFAELKIITCMKGEIFDVAIDIRSGSKTFLDWHGEIISAENKKSIVVPEGFAHGFQTLSNDCELIYLHTNYYKKTAEGGLHVRDKKIGIEWLLPIKNLSEKDQSFKFIEDDYSGVKL
jgi:dTDP-4-dehydrorhamnose 3,5-epimerase